MLRCVKEQGIYCEFKQKLKRYIEEHMITTETGLLKHLTNPSLLLLSMDIRPYKNEDEYINTFYLYLYKNYKENFIECFEKFLKEHGVEEKFFNNVNFKFIAKESGFLGNVIFLKEYTTKKEILYNNLVAPAFIMNSFHWVETPQGRDYWSKLNSIWDGYIKDYIAQGKYRN